MKLLVNVLILVLPWLLQADMLRVKDTFPAINVQDQFDNKSRIVTSTKQLIIAFSKEQGESIKQFLQANPTYLNEHNALYWMDTSKVPSFVMSMFMMPKFKEYPYTIGIIEDEKILSLLPKEEGKITILTLDNLTITNIVFKEAL